MQVGSGDIAPHLLKLATSMKNVVTSHLARSTQGRNPTAIEDDASWPQEQLWTLCMQYVWNETGSVRLPVQILLQLLRVINFQLYQPSVLYRPELVPEHVGSVLVKIITREVCLRTYNVPLLSFHQVPVRVFRSSTSATIKYNFGSSQGH